MAIGRTLATDWRHHTGHRQSRRTKHKYPVIRRPDLRHSRNSRICMAHEAHESLLILDRTNQLISLAMDIDDFYLVIIPQMLT